MSKPRWTCTAADHVRPTTDSRQRLQAAIIGAGATGVEFAAAARRLRPRTHRPGGGHPAVRDRGRRSHPARAAATIMAVTSEENHGYRRGFLFVLAQGRDLARRARQAPQPSAMSGGHSRLARSQDHRRSGLGCRVVDAEQKFSIQQRIEEARAKIAEAATSASGP